jgi:hypothetical protein
MSRFDTALASGCDDAELSAGFRAPPFLRNINRSPSRSERDATAHRQRAPDAAS